MFEVHRGNREEVSSQQWRHSIPAEEVYRFQAVDPNANYYQHHPMAASTIYQSSSESRDINARIQRLCSSLQTLLDKSRSKDRTHSRRERTQTTTARRLYPPPRDWGVSKAELCEYSSLMARLFWYFYRSGQWR